MFTVIICDPHIVKDCQTTYAAFFSPLLSKQNYAFCEWDIQGNTLETALPDLERITEGKPEWRAVIVVDRSIYGIEGIKKRNPFAFVPKVKLSDSFETTEQIKQYRQQVQEKMLLALDNPLVKLSTWLSGTDLKQQPILPDCYENLPGITDPSYFEKVEKAGLHAAEIEIDRGRLQKYDLLSKQFLPEGSILNKPKQIIAVAERISMETREELVSAWSKKQSLNTMIFTT